MSTTQLDPAGMSAVIRGKRYSVNSSKLLASDCYWDGSNFTKHGSNTFLFRTRGGAYFQVRMTLWQGERDMISPIDRDDAIALWDVLLEHAVSYEEAFDAVVEEASAGRPAYFGEAMKQTTLWLPPSMIDWLKAQPEGMGETLRSLVKTAMEQK